MFTFYSLVTIVMQRTSATMFNLSILTADFYTLLISLFVFKYDVRIDWDNFFVVLSNFM